LRALSAELRQRLPSSFVVEGIFRQQQLINDTLVRERLLANVANVFGVLAFVLATAGLYGIMSYLVAQRRQELGIRMAMGAEPSSIMTLVIKESTRGRSSWNYPGPHRVALGEQLGQNLALRISA
jgi:ABC-type lipoprotein release transport system permease subunit